MIVSIHQPHFFPWLGYLDRMRRCHCFVILDHVQFERQNYQNRVAIKTLHGPRWLVVPVQQRSRSERIIDKHIEDSAGVRRRWSLRALHTLEQAYGRAPFFERWAAAVRRVLESNPVHLVDLNLVSIELLREAFAIRTPLIRSSSLALSGHGADLVLEICQVLGASAFLGGLGASRRYIDPRRFREAGVEVLWQGFSHPRYAQHPLAQPFTAGLSGLDTLFNCGPACRGLLDRCAASEADAVSA